MDFATSQLHWSVCISQNGNRLALCAFPVFKSALTIVATFFLHIGFSQIGTITITDDSIGEGQELRLQNTNEYLLDGYVFVEDGACLTIEPGTVIRGKTVPTNGDLSSALIITRGGQIKARGTVDRPIIFTSELDDLATTQDLTATDNQTWGGLIILGKAPIGEDTGAGETFPTDVIEGIPSDEPRIRYGGTDAEDNSGVLTYVSIRHGGAVLGADNEINGLTLGGVGSGTFIDYIEVFANKDDGIEIFGGTVNITHAVVAFCGDDSYDIDEGWDGYIQFAFSLQDGTIDGLGDHAVEYDGSEAADRVPRSVGRFYNGTFIGSGVGSENSSSNGLRIREDAAAQFWNCIWIETTDYMFRFDDTSVDRLLEGESKFVNNLVFGFGSLVRGDIGEVQDAILSNGTRQLDPDLGGVSRIPDGGLDPRPNIDSPALGEAALTTTEDPVMETNAIGAFNCKNWMDGWTALDQYGYIGDLADISSGSLECLKGRLCNPENDELRDRFQELRDDQLEFADKNIASGGGLNSNVITIPVVIHNIYTNPLVDSVGMEQIQSQITALNRAFRRLNYQEILDDTQVPGAFMLRSADARIEFVLAQRLYDEGNCSATSGVEYRYNPGISAFDHLPCEEEPMDRNPVMYEASNGLDPWDPQKYLNVWVVDMVSRINGYATIPEDYVGLSTRDDGIVVDFTAFGDDLIFNGTAESPTNRGKTMVRLVGDWLGIFPLSGSRASCRSDDGITDTPKEDGPTPGCPGIMDVRPDSCVGSSTTANGHAMFMNYLSGGDEECRVLFTLEQTEHMWAAFWNRRRSFMSSEAHLPPSSSATFDPWISDNKNDVGEEENLSTDFAFDSPDIWVRRANDSLFEHQNPVYKQVGDTTNYVYVRVRNRSCSDPVGALQGHVYWTKSSTGFELEDPFGSGASNPELGGFVGSFNTGLPLQPGQTRIFELEWTTPDSLFFDNFGDTLLASVPFSFVVKLGSDPVLPLQQSLNPWVLGSNDVAVKNVIVVDSLTSGDQWWSTYFIVGNYTDHPTTTSLHFMPEEDRPDSTVVDLARIALEVNDLLDPSWDWNSPDNTLNVERLQVQRYFNLFVDESMPSVIRNIPLEPGEKHVVKVRFTRKHDPAKVHIPEVRKLRVFQYSQASEGSDPDTLVGGQTLVVKSFGGYPFAQGYNLPIERFSPLRISSIPMTTGVASAPKQKPEFPVKVYPNPNDGNFFVEGRDLPRGPVQLELYNVAGQKMGTWQSVVRKQDWRETLRTNHLPDGLYFLHLTGQKFYSTSIVTIIR